MIGLSLLCSQRNRCQRSLDDDDVGAELPPTQIIVPLATVDGDPVSSVNDITVRLYVQSGNGKKIWWSYTDVSGVNP